MDASLDDDLRDFEDLLSLLPPTDPLDSQISALIQQPTVSTTTTPTAKPTSTRSFVEPLLQTNSAVPITIASKPPPLKVSSPDFRIPLVPSNSKIKKRTQIVRPYKILTTNTPVSTSQYPTTIRRQPLHPAELNTKLHIQLEREQYINSDSNPGFDMDLNYALNPLINRFKLEAYHPIKKMFSITNSLLEYQKIYVPAKYLTAKLQTPKLDDYTEQIQRSHILETHQIRELKKQIHNLKTKNHQLIARLEGKW